MMGENEAYAEWLAAFIQDYLMQQLQSGRSVVMESEIWQMLGTPMPAGHKEQRFVLREYVDNVIPFKRPN
jgi:hypothetical protein